MFNFKNYLSSMYNTKIVEQPTQVVNIVPTRSKTPQPIQPNNSDESDTDSEYDLSCEGSDSDREDYSENEDQKQSKSKKQDLNKSTISLPEIKNKKIDKIHCDFCKKEFTQFGLKRHLQRCPMNIQLLPKIPIEPIKKIQLKMKYKK